jgi:hypothetical protein
MINQLDIKGINGIVGSVFSSIKVGDKAFLGGNFVSINGQPRSNFAVIDLVSGNLDPISHTFDGQISVIKQISGDLIVLGGAFKKVDGSPNLFMTLYQISTDTFTALLPENQYSIVASAMPFPVISCLEYDSNTNTVWAGGMFILYNGSTNIYHFIGVNLTNLTSYFYQMSPTSTPTNYISGRILSMSLNPSTSILYVSTFIYPTYLQSFNVSNPSSITQYSWTVSANTQPDFVFYNNSRVYVSAGQGATIAGLSMSNYSPLATNYITGAAITTPNFSIMKNQFIGDNRIFQMIFNNDRVYICGMFTDVKNISGAQSRVPRHSFAAFDTSGNPVGDFIQLSNWSTIYYIPPTPFQSFQPPTIYSMLVDADKIHLFGTIRAVEGTAWNKGHYIVDINGKKLQTKFIF